MARARWDLGEGWQPRKDERGKPLPVDVAFADLDARMSEAWAVSADGPGAALHAALCRAAGVEPSRVGANRALEQRFDYGRSGWYQIIKSGGWPKVIKLAKGLGLAIVAIPDTDLVACGHPAQLVERLPPLLLGEVPDSLIGEAAA